MVLANRPGTTTRISSACGRVEHEDADAGKPDCYGICVVPSIRFWRKAVAVRLAGVGDLEAVPAGKPCCYGAGAVL